MSELNHQPLRLLELCKAMGNETRFQIIQLLFKNIQFCGDLVSELGIAQSTVSHHLKILRQAGIVIAEEQGSWVCYRLSTDAFEEMRQLLSQYSEDRHI